MSHQRRRCTGLCWAGSNMTLMGGGNTCPGWVWFLPSNCAFSNITVNHRIRTYKGLCLCNSILVSLFPSFVFSDPFYTHTSYLSLSINFSLQLMKCVRLPLLTRDFLMSNVDTELLVRHHSECKDLLIEALKYHLMPEQRGVLSNSRTRPRRCEGASPVLFAVGL